MSEFNGYLTQKKIDWQAFQKAEKLRYEEFKAIFDKMHPASFTAQKLYLINPIRRTYPLKEAPSEKATSRKPGKPRIAPRIK